MYKELHNENMQESKTQQYQQVIKINRGSESNVVGLSFEMRGMVSIKRVQDRPITERWGPWPVSWTLTFQGTVPFTDSHNAD